MTVYLVVDDNPNDGYRIIAGYEVRTKAQEFVDRLKAKDAYLHQYVKVEPLRLSK